MLARAGRKGEGVITECEPWGARKQRGGGEDLLPYREGPGGKQPITPSLALFPAPRALWQALLVMVSQKSPQGKIHGDLSEHTADNLHRHVQMEPHVTTLRKISQILKDKCHVLLSHIDLHPCVS